tara:strand:+ start:372 stop:4736 length:4365 start_codon:yes stop_codon:yes gene_type:complete
MAQTKNTFIKSRMNKDLDDRLVPNGEYRNALNVEISQSEGSDVGTVSTSLGNLKITDFDLSNDCEAKIIGIFTDERNKSIYVFVTNFIDTSGDKLSNFASGSSICQIWQRNIETNVNTKLVEGDFLNFSLTHHVLSINLLEDLLFWTDNRNQPRKINILKANPSNSPNPTYYTNEDQISVAKYYPFEPIELLNNYVLDFSISSAGSGVAPGYGDFLGQVVPTTAITGSGSGLTVLINSTTSSGDITSLSISNQGFGYENGDELYINPPSLQGKITLVVENQSTMKDKCTEFLPSKYEFTQAQSITITSGVNSWYSGNGSPPISDRALAENTFVKITNSGGTDITPNGKVRCTFVTSAGITYTVLTWNSLPSTLAIPANAIVTFGVNPDYDPNWPGDCEFLKDKFVRFAYRFKFEDNEYSLISPFTQACFIPKQNGYFLSQTRSRTSGSSSITETIYDSQLAYESTDLGFFENAVNSVDLKIPAPLFLSSPFTNEFKDVASNMHIKEVDIIYKDDSENVLKVVDTIASKDFENVNSNFIIYNYQSKAPIKTLPSNEITRVSDKVPVKSLTQEISGNRIIYGNYIDNHTSNESLNYEVAAAEKAEITSSSPDYPPAWLFNPFISKEYQNHTLKQNRNYQVGVVLSDRYGRQSDVIMSSLGTSSNTTLGSFYQGSTLFHPFYPGDPGLITTNPKDTWSGDDLKVRFNSRIPEAISKPGYPGLFVDYNPPLISSFLSTGDYKLPSPQIGYPTTTPGSGVGLTVDFTLSNPAGSNGFITNISINNPGAGYQDGDVITIGGSASVDSTFILQKSNFPNLTGWYSYKIVVKQQEQDYYNVYLPGIVNGAINEEGISSSTRSTISLYGDNINKIPKDLLDVGPSQTNYRSDTKLSLRVENTPTTSIQHYPGTDVEDVVLLSELTDLGINLTRITAVVEATGGAIPPLFVGMFGFNENIQAGMSVSVVNAGTGSTVIGLSDGAYVKTYVKNVTGDNSSLKIFGTTIEIPDLAIITFGPPGIIFNSGNNPIIGILSTSKEIGVAEENNFAALLAVAETKPVDSSLDVFFETTSSGLISTLNQAILAGTTGTELPVSISAISFNLDESLTGSQVCTNSFSANNIINTAITSATTTCSILSVRDRNNADRKSEFDILPGTNATFSLTTTRPIGEGYYVGSNNNNNSFRFAIEMTNQGVSVTRAFSGVIANKEPQYVLPLPPNVDSPNSGGTASDGDPYIVQKDVDSIVPNRKLRPFAFTAPFPGFKALNGSGDATLNKKDLTWELVSCIPIDGEDRPFDYRTLATTADGQIINLAYNRAIWPTVIRPAGSVTPADPLKSYQIEIDREYVNENIIQLIPGSSVTNNNGSVSNVSSSTTPSLSIVDDEALIYVHQLNGTIDGLTAEISVEDNSFLNFISWNNSNNNYTTQVSINIEDVVKFVTWECKLRVSDGGNLRANDITVQIKQK